MTDQGIPNPQYEKILKDMEKVKNSRPGDCKSIIPKIQTLLDDIKIYSGTLPEIGDVLDDLRKFLPEVCTK